MGLATTLMRRATGVAPLRAALARSVRTEVRTLSSVATTSPSSAPTVPPSKFWDNESLVAHQERIRHADPNNRTFNYAMIGGARVIGASAWRLVLVKFLAAMNPAADVLALASLEVDIGKLQPGDSMTVKWRGKPVFIRYRPDSEIEAANEVAMADLRDPEADSDRAQKPEHLVVLGVCTHLGCVPIGNAGDFGGWFCPCHGSHYDTSGRIRKGPAPLNLEVPPYSYLEDDKLMIG